MYDKTNDQDTSVSPDDNLDEIQSEKEGNNASQTGEGSTITISSDNKLTEELNEQKDKYLRLLAEFENYKRRSARESMEVRQTAGKEIILLLLDILDDCDRAEKQMQSSNDVQQIKYGVTLIFNKLRNTLQGKGLKAMETIDTDFDVEKHEAITEINVDEEANKGKVVDEVIKGYYLNDKLIRFAKVIVGK